jgi:hypothetical protein
MIYCTGSLGMTVAVEVEFDWRDRVLFVKTGPDTWRVAEICEIIRD